MSFYPFFHFTLSFRHTAVPRSSSLPCSRRAGAYTRGREQGAKCWPPHACTCARYGPSANCRFWRAVSKLPAGKTNFPPRRSSLSVRGRCSPIGRGISVAPRALPNYNNIHSMRAVASVTKAEVAAGLHSRHERRRQRRRHSVSVSSAFNARNTTRGTPQPNVSYNPVSPLLY